MAGVSVLSVAAAGQGWLAAYLGAGLLLLLAVVGEPTVRAVRAVRAAHAAQLQPGAASPPDAPATNSPADLPLGGPSPLPVHGVVDAPGAELSQALADGAVAVMFRPLRTLPELTLCGVESELRWNRQLQGLQPPDDWPGGLPASLSDALLALWLGASCQQFVRWLPRLDAQAGATLWLRLPALWLDAPGLAPALDRAVADSGLDRSRLRLRVTAQVAGRHATLPASAQRLREQGYVLAADAFGGGAASLAHLNDLPVRAVCLDRSLIERACHGPSQRLVVESTARLASSLGMQTLADGVASESQVLTLGELGCAVGLGEVCGPWLDAEDWSARWAAPRIADTA
jgi:EAL domain-containing protein (putative c-di-GMP-specific phosphodiesterase class I)